MATTSMYDALSNRMNYLVARQSIIGSNIANANTPGYIARDLEFEKPSATGAGSFAMALTNAQHMQVASGGNTMGGGKVTTDTTYIEHNGNSVRLDQQMLNLNQVQNDYRLMTELYSKQIGLQKIALRGSAQ